MELTWKRISVVGIGLLCCLGLLHIGLALYQKSRPPRIIYAAHEIEHKPTLKKNNTKLYAHLMPKPIDPQEQFYQTILENNIFAPLGWQPKKEVPRYKLIGTQVPSARKTDARAVLREMTPEQTLHVVSIGTKLGADIVVADIRPKQVILTQGKQRISLTLARIVFLR